MSETVKTKITIKNSKIVHRAFIVSDGRIYTRCSAKIQSYTTVDEAQEVTCKSCIKQAKDTASI